MVFMQLTGYAVLFPLLGFLFNGLAGRKIRNEGVVAAVGCAAVGGGFIVACIGFFQMLALPPEQRSTPTSHSRWTSFPSS